MATSNELFGSMKPGEEIVIRCAPDQRSYYYFIRKPQSAPPSGLAGAAGGTIPTRYTSAATLATAVQNALPTLYT